MTTVLVTGANRGIELALARQYTSTGAHVIVDAAADDAHALRETGAEIHPLDTSSGESITAFAVAAAIARSTCSSTTPASMPEPSLPGRCAAVPDITADQYLAVINVNVVGPMRLVQLPRKPACRPWHRRQHHIAGGFVRSCQRIGRDVSYNSSRLRSRSSTLSRLRRSEQMT